MTYEFKDKTQSSIISDTTTQWIFLHDRHQLMYFLWTKRIKGLPIMQLLHFYSTEGK